MKKLLSLACMCMIMFLGSTLSVDSQSITITCDNGVCTSSVTTSEDSWSMTIDCGNGINEYGGSGSWGGSLCGMSVIFL